jgi:hypothetical protein
MKMHIFEQRNSQRFSTLLLVFFFVGIVLLLGLPQSVHAETITVTNTLDDDSVAHCVTNHYRHCQWGYDRLRRDGDHCVDARGLR